MKKTGLLLLIIFLLAACSSNKVPSQKEDDIDSDSAEENAEQTNENGKEITPTSSDEIVDSQTSDEDGELYDEAKMRTVEIPSVYDNEGNFPKNLTQEEYEQLAKEQGIVRYALDDHPVRGITSQGGKVTNVTNLGDALIDITESRAYQLQDSVLPEAYQLFLQTRAEEFATTPDSEYRTWEEATNLERSIMQIVLLIAPSLNDLGYLIENDEFEHPVFPIIQEDFFDLGSPTVLVPGPQTGTDMALFEEMMKMKTMWEEIGKFDNPAENKEAFVETYKTLRSETNNLIVRVNFALTE
ncbi:hypothetical protein DVB69_15235 [Sporosarcina sp. BI001-red]|uniref:hypothetical protein n=1 Tax=Sporosarcina sp. BI001-red TaxID=2282866 RepID=UPI000E234C70|nr:hypothetical protein [Sporosarcina sp. BI001-red]REB05616.1 hypothetical protein DVB69_15235 [Sporosarcina sp. BI001-red]